MPDLERGGSRVVHVVVGNSKYSGPCVLRPLVHPNKYNLYLNMLKVVLRWKDIYTVRVVPAI